MLTPIPMVFFMSEFAAPTSIPNTPRVLKLDRDWNIVASRGFGKAGDPIC